MSFVQNLRSKPEKQKRKIMVVSLVILMLLVSFVWFLQFKMSSSIKNKMDLSQIFGVKNEVVDTYNDSLDKINDLKDSLGSI